MLEINKIYHGFRLLEESTVEELGSVARVFHHEKSGARLMQIANHDDNKVFSIGFRTPATDSTGVPHILEHCVLSGSRKYTTKEPFMDMVKGSLQTFINAMTFSDKTLYPVASKNEKDFFNLMDVYLDAVLYPKIYELPEIFMQEGWHHEIFNKEDKITYKGVVYNEMKGAYSSPETILMENIARSLYPDTSYQYSSGGNPDEIPELTYEDFLNFHKTLYHPSNSYIYLYGDGYIDKQLSHINDNYLSNFDRIEVDSHIAMQLPFTTRNEIIDYYSISMDDNDENKTYLSLNFVLADNTDLESYLMNNIIGQILIDSEAAPLKKALILAEIGEDIFSTNVGGLQPGFGIVAKNTTIDKKDLFKETIYDTLNKIVEDGLDKSLIEAAINIVEYDLREASKFPTKGLIYNMLALDSWLYDGNPISHLKYGDVINGLREKINTSYFEDFIKKYIINNPHSSLVIIQPKKGLGEEKEKILERKLDEYKKSLTEEELDLLILENNKLKEMQLGDDTEEAKATIPKLSISDVNPRVEEIPQEILKDKDTTILFHNIFTSKIAYLDLYFDISMLKEEHIPYANLLAGLLGKMDTETRSYSDLSNSIYVASGGIDFQAGNFINPDESFNPKIVVKGKAIGDGIVELIKLISEIIRSTKLEDYSRIKEIILQIKSRMEMNIVNRGNDVASARVSSYFSAPWNYTEKLIGLDFYWFICDMIENFDEKKEVLISNLKEVYKTIFNRNNLILSFTGDEEDLNIVKNNLGTIVEGLNSSKIIGQEYSFKEEKLNEGILSTSNVQYVSKGYNFNKLGYEYTGNMRVLMTILNGDYLHNRIRAQGGAYGAGISLEKSGRLVTYSYRDPNLKNTVAVYDQMSDFISKLNFTESELTQFIIGTMARLDPATTPHMKGQIATARYITNESLADVQKTRDQVLSTSLDNIKSMAPLLADTMKEEYLCVLGNEAKIKEEGHLFKRIVKLNK